MGFLKKLGQILLKGTQIVTGLGPLLPGQAGTIARVADTLEKIAGVVTSVEVFGGVLGTSGPDKLKAAVPAAAQIVLQSDILAGKKIENHPLFMEGVGDIVTGLVKVFNSVKADINTSDVN